MVFNVLEARERLKAERAAAFYGKRFWYNSASNGRVQIGVMQGLGDFWIVAFFRESGSRRSVNTSRLPANECPDALQKMFEDWANQKGLEEVP